MGRAVFPPCYLTWDQTMVNVMKIMVTSFKRSHAQHFCTQCLQPCSRPLPSQTSAGDSWTLIGKSGSVSCRVTAPFSWVLVPTRFVSPKNLFPQSCVSSGSSMVGLMVASSKRAYAYPGLLHPESLPLQQSTADTYLCRRHSNTVLSQSLWGLWVLVHRRFVWALWVSLVEMGFDSKCDFSPATILLGLLCPWTWGISSQLLPCHAASQWFTLSGNKMPFFLFFLWYVGSWFLDQEWNPCPPAVEVWSLNHWTTKEVPGMPIWTLLPGQIITEILTIRITNLKV